MKQGCHRSLMYKVELIYTKIRHKGLSIPELALQKKRKRRPTICYILTSLVQTFVTICGCSWACWIENLLQITNMKFGKPQRLAGLCYCNFCNVLIAHMGGVSGPSLHVDEMLSLILLQQAKLLLQPHLHIPMQFLTDLAWDCPIPGFVHRGMYKVHWPGPHW